MQPLKKWFLSLLIVAGLLLPGALAAEGAAPAWSAAPAESYCLTAEQLALLNRLTCSAPSSSAVFSSKTVPSAETVLSAKTVQASLRSLAVEIDEIVGLIEAERSSVEVAGGCASATVPEGLLGDGAVSPKTKKRIRKFLDRLSRFELVLRQLAGLFGIDDGESRDPVGTSVPEMKPERIQ